MRAVLLSVSLVLISLFSGAQIISNHFVELDTVIYGESNAYWLYTITNGSNPAISHVVFDSSSCLQLLSAGSWSGDISNPNFKNFLNSNQVEVQQDPTTKKFGIKFDDNFFDGNSVSYVYLEYDRPTEGKIDTVWFKSGGEVTYKLVDVASCKDIPPIPVTLNEYRASRINDFVVFTWSTASEINNDYFSIETLSETDEFVSVGVVQGHGTSNVNLNYRLPILDERKGTVYYRLRQVDFDGTEEVYPVLAVGEATVSGWTISNTQDQVIVSGIGHHGVRVLDCFGKDLIKPLKSSTNQSIVVVKASLPKGVVIFQNIDSGEVRKVLID